MRTNPFTTRTPGSTRRVGQLSLALAIVASAGSQLLEATPAAADEPPTVDLDEYTAERVRDDLPLTAYTYRSDDPLVDVRVENLAETPHDFSITGDGAAYALGSCTCEEIEFQGVEIPQHHNLKISRDGSPPFDPVPLPAGSALIDPDSNSISVEADQSSRIVVTAGSVTVEPTDDDNDGIWIAVFPADVELTSVDEIRVRHIGAPYTFNDPDLHGTDTNTYTDTVLVAEGTERLTVTDRPGTAQDRAKITGLEPGQSSRVVVTDASDTTILVRDCDPADTSGFESCPIFWNAPGDTIRLDVLVDGSWVTAGRLEVLQLAPGEARVTPQGHRFEVDDITTSHVNPDPAGATIELALRSDGQVRATGTEFEPGSVGRITVRRNGAFLANHFGIADGSGRISTSNWVFSGSELQPGDLIEVGQRRRDPDTGAYSDPTTLTQYSFVYAGIGA